MKNERSRKRRGARLGQHFLTGTWAAKKLTEAVHARPGETILEIGPGKGALTKELLQTGRDVIAIEKDEELAEALKHTFEEEVRTGQLKIIVDDIRNIDPGATGLTGETYVLAANIPYYITGEILRKFLSAKEKPRAAVLLIQKEVADRIVARNGKESVLSISVKAYGTPRIVAKVSRGNFSPPPSVDSAILQIEAISPDFFDSMREEDFFSIVKAGFSSKRKRLANNLNRLFKERGNLSELFVACDIEKDVRAEDVPLSKWKCLAEKAGQTR